MPQPPLGRRRWRETKTQHTSAALDKETNKKKLGSHSTCYHCFQVNPPNPVQFYWNMITPPTVQQRFASAARREAGCVQQRVWHKMVGGMQPDMVEATYPYNKELCCCSWHIYIVSSTPSPIAQKTRPWRPHVTLWAKPVDAQLSHTRTHIITPPRPARVCARL
jgi:hypothetical protein